MVTPMATTRIWSTRSRSAQSARLTPPGWADRAGADRAGADRAAPTGPGQPKKPAAMPATSPAPAAARPMTCRSALSTSGTWLRDRDRPFRLARVVGAEQQHQRLPEGTGVARELPERGQPGAGDRPLVEAAGRPQGPLGELGQGDRDQRAGQQQPVPARSPIRGRRRATVTARRNPHTAAIGTVAATSDSSSPTWVQASSAPTATGTYQRGAVTSSRPSPQSSSSSTSRTGTEVPKWSGFSRKTSVPPRMDGASMMATAIPARRSPAGPVARPRASSPASATVSV